MYLLRNSSFECIRRLSIGFVRWLAIGACVLSNDTTSSFSAPTDSSSVANQQEVDSSTPVDLPAVAGSRQWNQSTLEELVSETQPVVPNPIAVPVINPTTMSPIWKPAEFQPLLENPSNVVTQNPNLSVTGPEPILSPLLTPHSTCAPPCSVASSESIDLVPYQPSDFSGTPVPAEPYNPCLDAQTYFGKYFVPAQRPWIEWWRPFYSGGIYDPAIPVFTDVNPLTPHFLVYGDYRAAVGVHRNNGQPVRSIANRLNLDLDLRLTGTERIHAFMGPLDHNNRFTRLDFSDSSNIQFEEELDAQLDTAFFEGDLGAMTGGLTGIDAPFDLPFTAGRVPLLYQNGIWMEDAVDGVAIAFPWQHNQALNWSNYDITFFAGFNQVTSPAFANNNQAAEVFGTAWFIEAYGGYIEADYAYLNDKDSLGRSYHNTAIAYTRRYWQKISNSIRILGNHGQDGPRVARTADGILLLVENSWVTRAPSTVVPYWNGFLGYGRPQSVARAAGSGGILRNTGINFESDNLTGYPTLDATGSNAYGGAIGINILSSDFSRQFVVEFAALDTYGDAALSTAPGAQYGLGTRWQKSLSNWTLVRVDLMHGWLDNAPDIFGTRAEFRWKF
jgi:hypothetical protein